GVATIYQELSLVPQLSVAENILLGHEPARAGWIDRRALGDAARRSIEDVGITLDLDRRVDRLGLAEQQMVELAKALFRRARVLVMDEPTSALTAREIDRLFDVVRRVTAGGVAGLLGAGRTELARVIAGADRPASGRVFVKGREVTPKSPRHAIRAGVGFLPEDRKRHGLVLQLSVQANIGLPNLQRWSRGGV